MTTVAPLRRGEFVRITTDDRSLDAMVTLASPNGRSIMLMFDSILGGFVGAMPASLEDDGQWRALNGMPFTLDRIHQ